jgi:glycosyltransferase involved in cell wall biosynthesis
MTASTLVVTGDVASPRATIESPRRDYDALSEYLGADLLHAGMLKRPLPRVMRGLALARAAAVRASDYSRIYCDSEHIGIPLAFLLRRTSEPRLSMIAHYLTPKKKRWAIRKLVVAGRFETVALHSSSQREAATSAGFEPPQLPIIPYQVDAGFWRPALSYQKHVVSAGREFRDYPTLLRAADGLGTDVHIAAGSPWSQRRLDLRREDVPENVTIGRLGYGDLRTAYAAAHFVVVPLHNVDFQAGIITILEAMAMGRAVIVSRTKGQTGVISGPLMLNGELRDIDEHAWPDATGIYVPPGNVEALRSAMQYLLRRPDIAERMGAAGRAHVEANFTLDHFVRRLAAIVAPSDPKTYSLAAAP